MATGKTQAILPVTAAGPEIKIIGKLTGDIQNATAGKLVISLRVVDSGKFAKLSI